MRVNIFLVGLVALMLACKGDREAKQEETVKAQVTVPVFNADSAYQFIQQQVDFGPRVPNTEAHKEAGDYLVKNLKRFGAAVYEQSFTAQTYDGQKLNLRNIIGSFKPDETKRILLAAHWDTRPFSDKDPDQPNGSFDGANDGGSGVGVLLEISRLISELPPNVGVDVIFFDGEDWGERIELENTVPLPEGLNSWWCLGSQHWSKNKHKTGYSAYYGILVDMVGASRAQFYREKVSLQYAPKVVEVVWNTAERIGYSDYFVKQNAHEITDDHVFVNTLAKIPMIDIVEYKPETGYFGDYHHTQKDNISIISKETLKAVGATLAHVIYQEPPL